VHEIADDRGLVSMCSSSRIFPGTHHTTELAKAASGSGRSKHEVARPGRRGVGAGESLGIHEAEPRVRSEPPGACAGSLQHAGRDIDSGNLEAGRMVAYVLARAHSDLEHTLAPYPGPEAGTPVAEGATLGEQLHDVVKRGNPVVSACVTLLCRCRRAVPACSSAPRWVFIAKLAPARSRPPAGTRGYAGASVTRGIMGTFHSLRTSGPARSVQGT